MAWKTGEVWLDADLRWFREGPSGAAVAVFVPPPLPSFPAPGLAASRARRQEWSRRRKTRKLRRAALALTPAVVLPVTAFRNTGGGAPLVLDDPPSLTIHLGPRPSAPPRRPADEQPGAKARSLQGTEEVPRTATGETAEPSYPPVVWHQATSVGLPWDGHLIDGTQLPLEGRNWVTWNPVTDSVPNNPNRLYGNERTVRTVIDVIDAYRAANPGAPPVVVGDLSWKGGGPMTDEHVSHQNGLDVDVYYPRLDGKLLDPVSPENMDRRLSQDLLDRFVAAGAEMIFVGPNTGLTGPSGIVFLDPNHENHMHVRFPAG